MTDLSVPGVQVKRMEEGQIIRRNIDRDNKKERKLKETKIGNRELL